MKKNKVIHKVLLAGSIICFVLAALLIVWSYISQINFLEEKFEEYILWLTDIEYKVASIENIGLVILVVLLMYFIKTTFPIFPISIICVASAMVFSVPKAFIINIAGLFLMYSVKYAMGKNAGGGGPQKLIRKSKMLTKVIEDEGQGNQWTLLVLRLVPIFPPNPVSQMYGAMNFPFWKYTLISILGFMPTMACYIIIGNNMANPFSLKFSIPLIMTCLLTGLVLLALYFTWNTIGKFIDKTEIRIKGE